MAVAENGPNDLYLGGVVICRQAILLEDIMVYFLIRFVLVKHDFGSFRIVLELGNFEDKFVEGLSFGQIREFQSFVSGKYLLFINENLAVAAFTAFQGFIKDPNEFACIHMADFFH